MTRIETDHHTIQRSPKELFIFLTDFNNFEKLLPSDKIENWSATPSECSFRIKGMADIGMAIEDKKEFSEIHVGSRGKVPFSFKLDIFLLPTENEAEAEAYLVFSGDINPFMKMMIERPLSNFFNMLVKNLADLHA